MKHDPELDAARFLAGDLKPRARASFERHILECEECWRELSAARRGRLLAEQAREPASAELRDRVRALIASSATPAPASPRPSRGWLHQIANPLVLGLTAVVALVAAIGVRETTGSHHAHSQPAVITAALSAYSTNHLPGTGMVHEAMPDLSSLGLTAVGASSGQLADRSVDAFAYRSTSGERLVVFTSATAFPRAHDAADLSDAGGAWMAHDHAMGMVCARPAHSMLIVGTDDRLLMAADRLLTAQ